MSKRPRNIGQETLVGLRQLKRGTAGRVVILPPVATIRSHGSRPSLPGAPVAERINAAWHARNPMPPKAALEQRVAWHLRHAKACGCREIPATVVAELRRLGRRVPARRKADMKKDYDFSKARRNPYASRLRRQGAPARPTPRRPQ
jgi:hypothetical protein